MSNQRIKGQEISIRIIQNGTVVGSVDSISTFSDEVTLELKEAGYIGEVANRFDEVLNGYGGNFEFNVRTAAWNTFVKAIIDRAQRRTPDTVFNVIRTDLYPNGDSTIYTYNDVSWGAVPGSVPSRTEYVKQSMSFKCSDRPMQINQLA